MSKRLSKYFINSNPFQQTTMPQRLCHMHVVPRSNLIDCNCFLIVTYIIMHVTQRKTCLLLAVMNKLWYAIV